MFNKRNCAVLKEMANKDFTRMYFNDPQWEGGYNFYNRTIYKTALVMLNREEKTEEEVQQYISTINKLLLTYKTYMHYIKQIKHPYIATWFRKVTQRVISDAVRGSDLDLIVNEYNSIISDVINLNFEGIRKCINKVNSIIYQSKQEQRKEELLSEVIVLFPMAELINRIVDMNMLKTKRVV